MAAAEAIEATAVRYPKPPGEEEPRPADSAVPCGVRVGLIARADRDEAWRVARQRFPEDRKGQITHGLAMKASDSVWHKQLSASNAGAAGGNDVYWLEPFQNHKTFCPYLVGDYDRVAAEVGSYIAKGFRTFILDIPPSYEELEHTSVVFARALERLAA